MKTLFLTLSVFCVTTTWVVFPQRTQEPEENVAVRITMEDFDTHPKGFFTTPVHLNTSPNVKLNTVTFEMAYPKELSFSEAHRGFLLQSDRVIVETRTRSLESESQVTRITVSAGHEEGQELVLPDGLILYLDFRVSETVENRLVTVRNKILGVKTVDGKSLSREQLVADNPTIYILRTDMLPIGSCFFYMH